MRHRPDPCHPSNPILGMENSVVLLIRNLVMLACLFVVPLVALLGPSVTGFRSPRLVAAESTVAGPRAEPFGKERPRGSGQAMGVPNLPASMFAASAAPAAHPAGERLERKAAAPARTREGDSMRTVAAEVVPEQAVRVQPAIFSPAGLSESQMAVSPRSESVAWPPVSAASNDTRGSQQDYLETLTARLRELGAGYYLLECWGQQQKVYRFYCQMGEAGPKPRRSRRWPLTRSRRSSACSIKPKPGASPADLCGRPNVGRSLFVRASRCWAAGSCQSRAALLFCCAPAGLLHSGDPCAEKFFAGQTAFP
jgi:hypothetical protein